MIVNDYLREMVRGEDDYIQSCVCAASSGAMLLRNVHTRTDNENQLQQRWQQQQQQQQHNSNNTIHASTKLKGSRSLVRLLGWQDRIRSGCEGLNIKVFVAAIDMSALAFLAVVIVASFSRCIVVVAVVVVVVVVAGRRGVVGRDMIQSR